MKAGSTSPLLNVLLQLRLAKINGALKPVDSEGFTYVTFHAGDILNISGRPAEVLAVPGTLQTRDLTIV